jgi:DNA polymerase-3 subunit delta
VALKAHEADRALTRPDPAWRVFLVYGSDHGLVNERARGLVAAAGIDPGDPFQLVRLDGGEVAADPLKLADEANTIGLFGGQRAIWVGPTSRPLLTAVEPLLATPPRDSRVVIEAGDLNRTNPLRLAIEKAVSAAAIPCFPDQGRSLAAMLDSVLSEHGLTIDPDARTLLLGRLGADRQLSRREIEKLALYVAPRQRIMLDDVDTIVGDASAKDTDDVVDAAFTGQLRAMDGVWARLIIAGEDPSMVLGFALRHAQALALARDSMDRSAVSAADAAAGLRGVSFLRKAAIETGLRRHTSTSLSRAIQTLHAAIAHCRRQPGLAPALALRALWTVAMSAPEKG